MTGERPSPPATETFPRWLLLPAGMLFLFHASTYFHYLLDDAYISLRYAQNLVEGHGLVFNPGERVEGYTNFLWVLLGALFLALGVDAMAALGVVSFLCMMGLLFLVSRMEKSAGQKAYLPAVFWLLLLEGTGYWASTGMETTLFATLFLAGIALGLKEVRVGRRQGSVVIYVLLALTRPEGVLSFALGHAAFLLAGVLSQGISYLRQQALRHLQDGVLFGLLYGLYFAWRFSYYGQVLPNTYYAKVTGGNEQLINGLINLQQWTLAHPTLACALLLPGVFLAKRRWRTFLTPEFLALWFIALSYGAYIVSVGGDFMPFFRFFLPIAPLCALLLTWQFAAFASITPRRTQVALVLLVGAQLLAGFLSEQRLRAFVAHRTTVVGQEVGHHFARTFEPTELIAVNTAGSLPYESRLPTLDMLGLTDAAIAHHPVYVISPLWAGHRRGWGDYVLSRKPRAVLWYNAAGLAEPHYLGDHQLADNPFFRFFYQLHRTELFTEELKSTAALGYFPGIPFGRGDDGQTSSPDLGVRFEIRQWPLLHTVAFPAPIQLYHFQLRRDNESLWPLMESAQNDLDPFLTTVTNRWRQSAATRNFDPELQRRAEALCDRALASLQADDRATARNLLTQAAALGDAAGSPRVYQYISNLAVLEGQLFLAAQAQQQALRLAPNNELYQRNLRSLLTVAFKDFDKRSQTSTQG